MELLFALSPLVVVALGAMLLIGLVLYLYFRKIKWL